MLSINVQQILFVCWYLKSQLLNLYFLELDLKIFSAIKKFLNIVDHDFSEFHGRDFKDFFNLVPK